MAIRDKRGEGFSAAQTGSLRARHIDARARRNAPGSALRADCTARNPQLSLWVIGATAAAQHLYQRRGFAAVTCTQGPGNDEGLRDLRMTWKKEAEGCAMAPS